MPEPAKAVVPVAEHRKPTDVWTVFLDRDGVLNRKPRDGQYVRRWDEFEWLPDAQAAVRALNRAGALTVLVTNQRGVAKGLMQLADVERIHHRMRQELHLQNAWLDAVYVCPHGAGTCGCRKPEPGLLRRAQHDFPSIHFDRAFMVGDSDSDMEAGRKLGCRTIGIRSTSPDSPAMSMADEAAPSLFDAVNREILPHLRRSKIARELNELSRLAAHVGDVGSDAIERLVGLYVSALAGGGKLCFAGNGGSAADAQHVATEYMVRYGENRRAIPAIALTTDTSLLTACGNDYSFEDVFARQVEALCGPRDLLVLHSTSGDSPNLCRAAEAAKRVGCRVAALLGRGGGRLKEMVDEAVFIPSDSTSHIQEVHLAIEHVVCGLVERELRLV